MNSFYFTLGDGQTHGPVSQGKLASYLENGVINAETMVIAEGGSDWMPMGALFEITKIPLTGGGYSPPKSPIQESPFAGTGSNGPASAPPVENPIAAQIRASSPVPEMRDSGTGKGVLRFFGNLLWLVSGVFMSLGYLVAGIISILSIIGIGSGMQSFKLANYALWPFGRTIENSPASTGCLVAFGNGIWFLLGGLLLSLGHVFWGVVFYIFVITIPLGQKHFELARLALAPYGKKIVRV